MKQLLLILCFLIGVSLTVDAQKYLYTDGNDLPRAMESVVDTGFINAGNFSANKTYYVQRSINRLDTWFCDSLNNLLLVNSHPELLIDESIKVHKGETPVSYLNQNMDFPYHGNYLLTVSFNYNVDGTTSDGVVYMKIGGLAIDLNDRGGDAQGANQILRTEVKDAVNGNGGQISGTGSGQKLSFQKDFYVNLKAGAKAVELFLSNEDDGVETSIWNFVMTAQLVSG